MTATNRTGTINSDEILLEITRRVQNHFSTCSLEMALYRTLPGNVYENASKIGLKSKIKVDNDFVSSFLLRHLPSNRLLKGEGKDLQYKSQNLVTVKKRKKESTNRKRKKGLTSKERKKLKLFEIKKEGQSYEKYIPMHRLWKQYIKNALNTETITENNIQASQEKLLKADYHGSHITVQRSTCPSFVGVSGIVLQETRNTFKLITTDNKVKCIPKMNSIFAVEIGQYLYTIHGNQFCVKSADRCTKKFKTKSTIEL